MRTLVSIQDNQGRLVTIASDLYNVNGITQFNFAYNSSGGVMSLAETQNIYDNGYEPFFMMVNGGGEPLDFRGELAQRLTTAYQYSSASRAFIGQTLCSNSYAYDNAGNRLTNTVATATVNSSGTAQYQGGTPTLGTATSGPFPSHNGYLAVNYQPVTNQLSTTRTETYAYDDLNRLSTVNYGEGETQSYAFDAMGNRLSRTDTVTPQSGGAVTTTTTSTFDAANRITGVSTNGAAASPITSDADGNTLTDAGGRAYTWDAQNRMTSCTYNGTTTTFTYGADGLRRSLTVNGVTTYYGYDGSMLVREYKVNTQTDQLTPTASYMPGPTGPICRVDETNQTEGYYPAGVSSTAPLGRGVTHWYIYDGLGSVIGELDDNNNLTASRQYDVYGAPRANTQQGGAATSSQGYVGSLGHVTDAGTGGLIYMQARYYDPGLGRFVSEDTGRNGTNWFAYAADNPGNNVDADGKSVKSVAEEILAIVYGLMASQVFRGIFIAACSSLLLPELPLLEGIAGGLVFGPAGGLDTAVATAAALCWGIQAGYAMAVSGAQETAAAGPKSIATEVVGLIVGYDALLNLSMDEMDTVDNS